MPKVNMINSTIDNVAKDFNRYAKMDRSFAERLVFYNNIRGYLTHKALKYDLGVDIFDRAGKVKNDEIETIVDIIKNNKLNYDSTWFDAIKASHSKWLKSKNPDKNTYTLFDYMENPI